MRRARAADPVEVLLLALRQTTPASLLCFYELFASVGVGWEQLTGEPTDSRRMATRIVARDDKPFPSALGPPIVPHLSLSEAGQADVVIVTDLALEDGLPAEGSWAEECEGLRAQYRGGATVSSVCTGSLLLASAGLLDGLDATTHWAAVDLFRTSFPRVRLRPERTLCPAGLAQRIVTSGGMGSWEDLALYLIARFVEPAEAARIAKLFVLGDRSSGQLAFSLVGRPKKHADPIIAKCQIWLSDHYMETYPVRRMIERSGLPERTFKRRFKAASGYNPVEYVQALRIEAAKERLEQTGVPIDDIAHEVGYEDVAFFRRLFKRLTGVRPLEYRRRFSPSAYLSTR